MSDKYDEDSLDWDIIREGTENKKAITQVAIRKIEDDLLSLDNLAIDAIKDTLQNGSPAAKANMAKWQKEFVYKMHQDKEKKKAESKKEKRAREKHRKEMQLSDEREIPGELVENAPVISIAALDISTEDIEDVE